MGADATPSLKTFISCAALAEQKFCESGLFKECKAALSSIIKAERKRKEQFALSLLGCLLLGKQHHLPPTPTLLLTVGGLLTCLAKLGADIPILGSHLPSSTFFTVKFTHCQM